jgi:hypothetical protein
MPPSVTPERAYAQIKDDKKNLFHSAVLNGARINRLPVRHGKAYDDQVLADRVRTSLGRVVSHPRAIAVTVQGGRVELCGPVLAHERQQLLDSVRGVAGVAGVVDRLEIHEKPDGISSLQGEARRVPVPSEFRQENWTPALRSIAVARGAVLGSYGLARRTPAGSVLAVVGLALLARPHDAAKPRAAPGHQLGKSIH